MTVPVASSAVSAWAAHSHGWLWQNATDPRAKAFFLWRRFAPPQPPIRADLVVNSTANRVISKRAFMRVFWYRPVTALAVMVLLGVSSRVSGAEAGKGALVICGGGDLPDTARATFVELAGGRNARIVVIPTASEYADAKESELQEFLDPWLKLKVSSASLLHTRSRARADAPEFLRPLEEATGVWFSGGDQSRVTEVYLGTAVERGLRAVLERGGVIGGTSAGAAIMSKVMITGGQEKATVGTGFGFLPGVVVDQHALRRNRVNRLLGVLADHPGLVGVAIDEDTALVVKQGRWQVLGGSYVVFCRPAREGQLLRFDFFGQGDQGTVDGWKPRP
jgi:cyanophycinase